MSSDINVPHPIAFAYEYEGHGWAHAVISDGVTRYSMAPSYVLSDPLAEVVCAVVTVLRYGGQAGCVWDYEPGVDGWILRREGGLLHITIRGNNDRFHQPTRAIEQGNLHFSTVCDLWKLAAKVRLAVSRIQPPGEHYHDPTWVQRMPEYSALCTLLDEHKRNEPYLRASKRTNYYSCHSVLRRAADDTGERHHV